MWRGMGNARVRQLKIEELDVEVDVVCREDATFDGGKQFASDVLKAWSICNVCIGDAMNLSGGHRANRIDERVKSEPWTLARIDSDNRHLDHAIKARGEAGRLEVDDRYGRIFDSSV